MCGLERSAYLQFPENASLILIAFTSAAASWQHQNTNPHKKAVVRGERQTPPQTDKSTPLSPQVRTRPAVIKQNAC